MAPWCQHPVGIVGLGLIGGSLGLDLQHLGVEVRALVHREATAERARQRGLASAVSTDPGVLAPCGLVVLALPLDRLLAPAAELVAALPPQAVVTDVGSVKAPVLASWSALVPRFVASHPMAGTAQAGVDAGQRGLFLGRPWVATPDPSTDLEALQVVRGLAEAVGAAWLCCEPEAHDQAVALISHVPVLVGAALLQAAAGAEGDPALRRRLASSGFADTTRVGGGNPELGTLMARCNRSAVLAALAAYRRALDQLEGQIQDADWVALQQTLQACQELRPEFL
ncbi:prephenate/arogenate dehydrogenase [Cyanobium sp. FACHB-13342]|uniref:prephenate/arogenate dehydrogenase n=1 Tax=Cyanobium sp. FACHB-13342 TaxID=2692793 RepID=UPI001680932C|nr:prephenate/arogenate dehydrogenase [Cyanobium sp. FACHB-13342]MBD2422414.1 prephenate/arogenate dehydrogenase [Cyanobium sp. FACHB-13342]